MFVCNILYIVKKNIYYILDIDLLFTTAVRYRSRIWNLNNDRKVMMMRRKAEK